MADVTVKKIDEMEGVYDGMFVRARASLGVTSFGMQIENLPPHHEHYPALSGSARLIVGDDEYRLEPGVFARVGPSEKRRIVPGPDGIQLLAIGAVPGEAYHAPGWSELGGAIPGADG